METPRLSSRLRTSGSGNDMRSAQPTPSGMDTSTYDVIPTPDGSEIYLPKKYELPPDPIYVEESITDPVTLGEIFDTCVDMYKTHKITPQNAFSLKLIECFDGVLKLDGFDKNNMQNVGKTLEVGTKIFSCRVEHTHHKVLTLAEDVADKTKKKRGNIIEDERDEGVDVDMPVNGNGGLGSDDEGNHNDTSYTIGQERENNFEQLEDGVIVPSLTFWNSKNPNKNILEDKDFDMDETCGDDNGEHRRLKLKESFDEFVRYNKKFDYSSFLLGKAAIDEKRQAEPATKLNDIRFINPVIVNVSAMGHMNTIGFLRFGKNKFDSECFDIWGNPLNAVGINKDDNVREKMLEKRRQLRERLSHRRDDLMSQSHQNGLGDSEVMDVDPPVYLPEGMDRDYDDGAVDMVQDKENLDPLVENGALREVNINEITTLDDLDRMYDACKNFKPVQPNYFGWMGPNFIRNRRPRNKTILKKKKPQPKPVQLLELDWNNLDNRFQSGSDLQTELDDEVIKKWANHKPFIPFMGECDDESELEDDYFNDAFEGALVQKDELPRILKYFIDHNRGLFEGILSRRPGTASQGNVIDGEGGEHDDSLNFAAGVSFHNGDDGPAPDEDLEGIRELEDDFTALGANENFVCEEDLDIMRRHKMLPSGPGLDFGSEAEEYPLSRFSSEMDSLKYARRPKPINISKVKDCIGVILREQLKLDDKGRPTLEEETTTDMMRLMTEMFRILDDNTLRYLTLAITLVATLHVTVDMRLFMDSGKLGSIQNPIIICHGKNWVHADHIPGITCHGPEIEPEEKDEAPEPKKRKAVVRSSLRRRADEALEALSESSGGEDDDEQDKEKENSTDSSS